MFLKSSDLVIMKLWKQPVFIAITSYNVLTKNKAEKSRKFIGMNSPRSLNWHGKRKVQNVLNIKWYLTIGIVKKNDELDFREVTSL